MATASLTSSVGQDQFLQLMVAQLKSQNPLEPSSNQEFLGQLAQFSTLSGIEKMNANFGSLLSLQEFTQGSNLIGKQVTYKNSENQPASGSVQGFSVTNGQINLAISGGKSISLDKVLSVTASA